MNYTKDDLIKIKQLLSSDIDNVKLGLIIAESLGISDEVLIDLFTIDDIIADRDKEDDIIFTLKAFDYDFVSFTCKDNAYRFYEADISFKLKYLRRK